MDEEYSFTLWGRTYALVSLDHAFAFPASVAHLKQVDVYEARSLVRAELRDNPHRLRSYLMTCFSGVVSGLSHQTPPLAWIDYIDSKLLDDWMPSHRLYTHVQSDAQVRVPVQAVAPAWTPEPTDWIEVAFVDQHGEPVPNVGYETELTDGRVVRGTTGKTGVFRTDGPPGKARVTFRPNAGGAGGAQLASFPGTHEVRQGQDMLSIAWAYGRSDWETIWNDSHNDALREECPEPMVLMPGARAYLPADDRAPESLAMGQRHEVVIEVPRVTLRIRFLVGDEPMQSVAFEYFDGEQVVSGTTDADGQAEMEVDVTQRELLMLLDDVLHEFDVGSLNPTSDASGILQRMKHLDYLPSTAGADALSGAVQAFQKDASLEPTGEACDETIDALSRKSGL